MKRLIAAWLLTGLMIAAPQFAQETSKESNWLQLMVVEVAPDKVEDFEDVLLTHWHPALKRSEIPWLAAWRQAGFGKAFTYAFISPMRAIGELDQDSPIRNAMKGDEYAAMMARLRRCVTSLEVHGMWYVPGASFEKLNGAEPKLAVFNTVSVKPDKHHEYARIYTKEIMPAMKSLDYAGVFSMINVFGGDSHEWLHILLVDSFSHLDKGPPMIRALGNEKADVLVDRVNALISAEKTAVGSYLSELSKPMP